MNKLNCNVVRDILPLYADEVVSEDTRQLVEAHLGQCELCRRELDAMRGQIVIPAQVEETASLKKFRQKWNMRQKLKGALAMLLLISLVIGCFFYVYAIGIPVKAERIMIRTGLQCVPEYDENRMPKEVSCPTDAQTWIVDIGVHSGDVRTRSEGVWEMNDSGVRVTTGVKIYVRWSPFDFPWDHGGTDWLENGPVHYCRQGVASSEMNLDPEADDFTVTIVCADREITYSMEAVGLYDHSQQHTADICPWAK